MKNLLLICTLLIVACSSETRIGASSEAEISSSSTSDEIRLCRLPQPTLDSLLSVDEITEADIKRCREVEL